MSCNCCTADRECAGHYNAHCPKCLWCGGRYLRRLGALPVIRSAVRQWQRKALADWMAQGHSEAELRELAKAPESLEPIQKVSGKRGR